MIENLTGQGTGPFTMPTVFPSPVKIVRVNLDVLKKRLAESANDTLAQMYLCGQERERFLAFRYEKRKVEWLAGRIAAKCAGLLLHHDEEEICHDRKQWQQLQITADSAGKPFISWSARERDCALCISISHSKKWAIAMAARKNCGIDIQQVTPAIQRVEARFAIDAEKIILQEIASLYGDQDALTLLWSAKEAVKKTCGRATLPGFLDIRLISLQESGNAYLFVVLVHDKESGETCKQLIWVRLLDGFAYAVTMQEQGRK